MSKNEKLKTISVHEKKAAVRLEPLVRLVRARDSKKRAIGAIVTFTGIVRSDDGVKFLEYESCRREAVRALKKIAEETKKELGVHEIVIHHVVDSKLCPGETVLQVVVSAAHRREAFTAARRLVDRIKRKVPIWKKAHYVPDCKKTARWIPRKNH